MFILIFDFVSVVRIYFLLGLLISGCGYLHFVVSCSGVFVHFFPMVLWFIDGVHKIIFINNGYHLIFFFRVLFVVFSKHNNIINQQQMNKNKYCTAHFFLFTFSLTSPLFHLHTSSTCTSQKNKNKNYPRNVLINTKPNIKYHVIVFD